MGVIYQERLFEGYVNVAIDNFIQDRNKIKIFVPSSSKKNDGTDEKTLGFDISFGNMLFIQYKSLNINKNKDKYSIYLEQTQKNILIDLEKKHPCCVFYVFPYHYDFNVLRNDFFNHSWHKIGTLLLKNTIFIPLYLFNKNSKNFKYTPRDKDKSPQYFLDNTLISPVNFFDWVFSCKGVQCKNHYKQYKTNNVFCPPCNSANPTDFTSINIKDQLINIKKWLLHFIHILRENNIKIEEHINDILEKNYENLDNLDIEVPFGSEKIEITIEQYEIVQNLIQSFTNIQNLFFEHFDIYVSSPLFLSQINESSQ